MVRVRPRRSLPTLRTIRGPDPDRASAGSAKLRPDRQVIRGPARRGAGMRAAGDDIQVVSYHDPIEHGDRAAGVKASSAGCEMVMRAEVPKTAAANAPLVEIAHQHG